MLMSRITKSKYIACTTQWHTPAPSAGQDPAPAAASERADAGPDGGHAAAPASAAAGEVGRRADAR